MDIFKGWQTDPAVIALTVIAVVAYAAGIHRFGKRRGRPWPWRYTLAYAAGVATVYIALESPLDGAGDAYFAPHMAQHLLLTDVAAPCILLGAPLLLLLGALSPRAGRRVVTWLRSRPVHILLFPAVTWTVFVAALWGIHFTPFFEAALEHEGIHVTEHALYLATALLFWTPVVAIGPVPWMQGGLAYPLRMLYLMAAMGAEGLLGFCVFAARRVLYPWYAHAGLADQQAAGEIMWIGGTLVMFIAFMITGAEWAKAEICRGRALDVRSRFHRRLLSQDR